MRGVIKSAVSKSGLAQRVYGGLLYSAGRRHLGAGRRFRALDKFCEARRRISSEAVTRRHGRALEEVVRAACCGPDGRPAPLADNGLLREYRALDEAARIRRQFAAWPLADRVRLREHRDDGDPTREGNLIVLKRPDDATGERGAILLKYNKSFAEMPAVFDLPAIVARYRIVLEPSTTNYIEPHFFLYACSDTEALIQCTQPRDTDFFEGLGLNFRTVRLGGGDWVDFDVFRPHPSGDRDYDLVMVASWAPMRRHDVLFRALERLRPRRPRVALIGYPERRTRDDLWAELRGMGLADQFEIFERIPPERVADIVGRSKAALLLSRFEGSNKGIHEALFCDTPVIVYRHHIGMNMSYVNPMTGILADDDELPASIDWMLGHRGRFRPREWALAHTGYLRSTGLVNEALRGLAAERGEPWTRDVVPKVNRPNLRYKSDADMEAIAPAYEALGDHLIEA